MQEDNLIKITPPEFKLHNVDALWDNIISLHQRRMEASMIAFHLNMQEQDVKDIIQYVKNKENASK
jgi:hypothetical protein